MQKSDKDAEKLYFKYEHYVPVTLERAFPNYPDFAKTHGLDKDDLLQLGNIGLFKAAKEYDSSKNASFSTFAIKMIRYAILVESKKYSLNNKTNRAYDLVDKTSMEYPIASTDGEVVDLHDVVEAKTDTFDVAELRIMIEKLSEVVSVDVAEAVRLKYRGYTFNEIGLALGMSAQSVQQMLKKNREILSEYLLA